MKRTLRFLVLSLVLALAPAAYGLQMTELEVYGKLTGPITLPVKIHFALANGILKLTWISGILESASEVTGPYAPVQNASSPLDVTPKVDRQFYRVRQ